MIDPERADVVDDGLEGESTTGLTNAEFASLDADVIIYTAGMHVATAIIQCHRMLDASRRLPNTLSASLIHPALAYEQLRRNLTGLAHKFKSRAEEWTISVNSDRPAQVGDSFDYNHIEAAWRFASKVFNEFTKSAQSTDLELHGMFPGGAKTIWPEVSQKLSTWPTFNLDEVCAYIEFEIDQAVKIAGGQPISEDSDDVEWIGPKSPAEWQDLLEIGKSTFCERRKNGIYRSKDKGNRLVWIDRRDLLMIFPLAAKK